MHMQGSRLLTDVYAKSLKISTNMTYVGRVIYKNTFLFFIFYFLFFKTSTYYIFSSM
jgi:hypothetical protein